VHIRGCIDYVDGAAAFFLDGLPQMVGEIGRHSGFWVACNANCCDRARFYDLMAQPQSGRISYFVSTESGGWGI
jgi:hypothetical protein